MNRLNALLLLELFALLPVAAHASQGSSGGMMGEGMMGGWMMAGCVLLGVLLIIVLVLVVFALIKYLRSDRHPRR